MKDIPSFTKNHDILQPGFYYCNQIKGVDTFDVRFKKPNTTFLSTAVSHTIEHLLATALRNGKYKDEVIYFGPMGCRTGFYLLTTELSFEEAKSYFLEALIAALDFSEVPGNKKEQCGNYLDHDLSGAKDEIRKYIEVIKTC